MEKIKLICNSCQYKFKKFNLPDVCPYCGKASVIEDLGTTAEDLLDEINY